MSLLDDQMKEENAKRKEDCRNAAAEHMAELEAKRIDSEEAYRSVKSNWESLLSKRSTQKVLRRLTLPRLQ